METNKALTAEQLDQLKATVRQRFDDLYHRIGTNRQKLANTVLLVDQSINKELTKEKIDTARERQILNKIREVEREASKQLPHLPKAVTAVPSTPSVSKAKPEAKPKAEAKSKPEKKEKSKAEPKAKPKKK
jgi:hypothetical protein